MILIANQKVIWRRVFLDLRKSANEVAKHVVGKVIIKGRDFTDQNIGTFRAESVPVAWH